MRVIDADGHLYEVMEEIIAHLDAPYAGRATIGGFPLWPTLDGYQRGAIHAHLGVHQTFQTDVLSWSRFLDATGIERSVLYPTHGLATGLIQDPEWAVALCRGYNRWCAARYVECDPRLHAMALLPLQEPSAAAEELEYAVCELHLRGAVLTPVGLRDALGERCFDPVYAAAQRLGVPLAVHGGPSQGLGLDRLQRYGQMHTLSHPIVQMVQLTSITMNGVFERFPDLRLGFLEAGAGWVPFMLDRMDRSFKTRKRPEYVGEVGVLPSQSLLSHSCFFGLDPGESQLPYAIQELGATRLLYGTDYPHEVNIDGCQRELRELQDTLNQDDFEAVCSTNARKFYAFDDPDND